MRVKLRPEYVALAFSEILWTSQCQSVPLDVRNEVRENIDGLKMVSQRAERNQGGGQERCQLRGP